MAQQAEDSHDARHIIKELVFEFCSAYINTLNVNQLTHRILAAA